MIRPSSTLLLPLRAACRPAPHSASAGARRTYASAPGSSTGGSSSSNLPLLLALAGLGGLGGWYALGGVNGNASGNAKKAAEEAKGKIADAVGSGASKPAALDKNNWKEFTLREIKPYNHDSATLTFDLPPGTVSGLSVASAVLFKGAGPDGLKDKDGKEVIRPYTPISAPDEEGKIDFLVKRYENGNMSKHAHALTPGSKLALKGPIPKFPYQANQFEEIALVGGGSGITPLWQLIQQIDSDPNDKTKVTLLYTNKEERDILLKEQFERLRKEKPEQFNIIYGLDTPPSRWSSPNFRGYLTPGLIAQHLPAPGKADKIKVFVCGPPPQVEAVCGGKGPKGSQGELKGLLADAGYEPAQVYKF